MSTAADPLLVRAHRLFNPAGLDRCIVLQSAPARRSPGVLIDETPSARAGSAASEADAMNGSVDWLSHLQEHSAIERAEFDIRELRAGDVLRVSTLNTLYTLRLQEERYADLETDRPNRPGGRVKIMGCTFGLSSTISPDHLFCGGNLEFTFVLDDQRMIHTTSEIRKLQLIRCGPRDGAEA